MRGGKTAHLPSFVSYLFTQLVHFVMLVTIYLHCVSVTIISTKKVIKMVLYEVLKNNELLGVMRVYIVSKVVYRNEGNLFREPPLPPPFGCCRSFSCKVEEINKFTKLIGREIQLRGTSFSLPERASRC